MSTQHSELAAQQLSQPLGILGGTFDPIHHGHLRLAQEALEQCQLAQIRFIPSGTPPHRSTPRANATHRLNMVRLALRGNDAFMLDEHEIHRNHPCYSVDTLTALRTEFGVQQPLCMLIGGDAFLLLHTWHEWQRLFDLAHIIVVQRASAPLGNVMARADAELRAEYQARLAPAPRVLHEAPAGSILVMDMPALEISATVIRKRRAEGRSLRYLLPDAVNNYILNQKLYTDAEH